MPLALRVALLDSVHDAVPVPDTLLHGPAPDHPEVKVYPPLGVNVQGPMEVPETYVPVAQFVPEIVPLVAVTVRE